MLLWMPVYADTGNILMPKPYFWANSYFVR